LEDQIDGWKEAAFTFQAPSGSSETGKTVEAAWTESDCDMKDLELGCNSKRAEGPDLVINVCSNNNCKHMSSARKSSPQINQIRASNEHLTERDED
jgi:hypothetical protein